VVGSATTKPYAATWQNPVSGTHQLLARATDSLGAITLSRVVTVSVEAPPAVSLTSPAPGTVAIAPATLTLTAMASDTDGSVAKVEFFNGGTLIGTAMTAPYAVEWANVPPGSYSFTAVATDNQGIQTTSAPVSVSVVANHAPTVALTSPAPGLSVKAPASVTISATASDEDNNLVKVEFFQNGSLIQTLLAPPYAYDWSNVPQGSYNITAVATDALGAQATSPPVTITVTPAKTSLYFIHPDHLGTPRLVTDQANAIVWRNLPTTEPFGNSPPEEDPNGTGQRFELPLAFPGQYRDRESNSNYNFFRDYDPTSGRYVQSDPIGLNGGINTYGYVNGNPISFIDPNGLDAVMHNANRAAGLQPDSPKQTACESDCRKCKMKWLS
jgi:RHS repeat-associated protein